MTQGTRLYINITNACNTNCPFCCMYSGTSKSTYMSFDIFRNIIDSLEGEFELQLEGGEPLLHKDLFLFLHYAVSTQRVKKIIILTNGIILNRFIKAFVDFSNWYGIEFVIKVSINYYLIENYIDHIKNIANMAFGVKYLDKVNMICNVRIRHDGDDYIKELLGKYDLGKISNIYFLQSYGKLTNSTYDKPVIVQNIDNWQIYSCDGACFNQDLIARSEHEKTLK